MKTHSNEYFTFPYFKLLVCKERDPSLKILCTSALIKSPSCKYFRIICSSSADLLLYKNSSIDRLCNKKSIILIELEHSTKNMSCSKKLWFLFNAKVTFLVTSFQMSSLTAEIMIQLPDLFDYWIVYSCFEYKILSMFNF